MLAEATVRMAAIVVEIAAAVEDAGAAVVDVAADAVGATVVAVVDVTAADTAEAAAGTKTFCHGSSRIHTDRYKNSGWMSKICEVIGSRDFDRGSLFGGKTFRPGAQEMLGCVPRMLSHNLSRLQGRM